MPSPVTAQPSMDWEPGDQSRLVRLRPDDRSSWLAAHVVGRRAGRGRAKALDLPARSPVLEITAHFREPDGRLHDARHTAATVLLILGVPERTVMGIMGWSSNSMAARYQHITDPIRHEVAARVDGLIWSTASDQAEAADTTETKTETARHSSDLALG
jgi:integrase